MGLAVAKSKRAFYSCPFCGRQQGGFTSLRRARRALEIHKGHKHPQSKFQWHRAGTMNYQGYVDEVFIGTIYKDSDGWIALPNVEVATFKISQTFGKANQAKRYVERTFRKSSSVVLAR